MSKTPSQPLSRSVAKVRWLFCFRATIPFLIWLLVSAPLHAATLRVPQNFATIQQGINAAANGDTVLVASGTYVENINFLGKAITVKSESGPEVTIIDGNRLGSVVTFMSGEAFSSVLQGFTIQNGLATQGGGITVQNSSPTITNNIITRNDGCDGLGIGTSFGSPIISGNQITNNHRRSCSGGFGGAGIIIFGNSSAQILNNIISNNSTSSGDGGGISLFSAGTPTIQGNIISGNSASGLSPCAQGGGIVIAQFGNALSANALIVQNLIVNNSAGCGGGIYWSVPPNIHGPSLVNNTIANNDSPQGSGIFAAGNTQTQLVNNIIAGKPGQIAIYCSNDTDAPVFESNNIFTSSGSAYGGNCADETGINGNISSDPLFLDAANDLYYLRPGSPAIDAGNNSAPNLPGSDLDADPRIADGSQTGTAVVDMGAFEVPPSPGIIHFKYSRFSAREDSGSAVISVIRKGGADSKVTVDFTTSDGTARAGIDYTSISGTLPFLNGETLKTFSIPIASDNLKEGTETVNLTLSNVTGGATLGIRSTATLSITEAGSLQFKASNYSVKQDAVFATIAITRALGSTGPVSVTFMTSNGTASAGSNYNSVTQTISFSDGDMSDKTVTVPILASGTILGTGTVNLTLSNPTGGAVLGDLSTAVLTILGVPGSLQFSAPSYNVNEDAGSATITITRTNGSAGTVSVTFTTFDSSAKAGIDYIPITQTVSFADGDMSNKTVTVPIINNNIIGGTKTLGLMLTNPTGGAVFGVSIVTLYINEIITTVMAPYFPLRSGASWTYQVDDSCCFTTTVLPGTTNINGVETKAFQDTDGFTEYLTNDGNGIRLHGQSDPQSGINVTFNPPVLLAAASMTIGQTVNSSGTAQTNIGNFGYSSSFTLQASDIVAAPLRSFNALRFQGTETISGGGSIARTIYWAKNVGLVKEITNDGSTIQTAELVATNLGSAAIADFDGDGKSDIAIYRSGAWSIFRSSDGGNTVMGWGGAAQDVPVPADYDGDGKTDIAIYRNGAWSIMRSSDSGNTVMGWGGASQDKLVPADYDGDGKADIAIYRDGAWSILRSSDGGNTVVGWGGAPQDILVPADYDGDGKTDIAIYRDGTWSILRSSDGGNIIVGWGGAAQDTPVPADYDGDGKADIAIYRNGAWSIKRSSDSGTTTVAWGGGPQDIPVPADYDGDGKADIAIYRNGTWIIQRSSDGGTTVVNWGGAIQDIPLN